MLSMKPQCSTHSGYKEKQKAPKERERNAITKSTRAATSISSCAPGGIGGDSCSVPSPFYSVDANLNRQTVPRKYVISCPFAPTPLSSLPLAAMMLQHSLPTRTSDREQQQQTDRQAHKLQENLPHTIQSTQNASTVLKGLSNILRSILRRQTDRRQSERHTWYADRETNRQTKNSVAMVALVATITVTAPRLHSCTSGEVVRFKAEDPWS